jgi:hypothetical protein
LPGPGAEDYLATSPMKNLSRQMHSIVASSAAVAALFLV